MVTTKSRVDLEVIAKAVDLACRAPSLHNSQPWRWTASDTEVDLHADAHRVVRSHELQWWTAPFRLSEGVPPSALVSSSEHNRVPVNRGFRASGYGDRRAATSQDEAKVLVLSTASDTREDAVNCGQMLSAVLLECTMAGFATCPMTHITELEASREVIRQLTGRKSMPQVLIRVGTAPSIEDIPAPTPRRSLREVLEFRRPRDL